MTPHLNQITFWGSGVRAIICLLGETQFNPCVMVSRWSLSFLPFCSLLVDSRSLKTGEALLWCSMSCAIVSLHTRSSKTGGKKWKEGRREGRREGGEEGREKVVHAPAIRWHKSISPWIYTLLPLNRHRSHDPTPHRCVSTNTQTHALTHTQTRARACV